MKIILRVCDNFKLCHTSILWYTEIPSSVICHCRLVLFGFDRDKNCQPSMAKRQAVLNSTTFNKHSDLIASATSGETFRQIPIFQSASSASGCISSNWCHCLQSVGGGGRGIWSHRLSCLLSTNRWWHYM